MASRNVQVLHSIVETYIRTGQPVASRTIARRGGRKFTLSAASIRNVMADLADDGYLAQPHTSAGRVPTEKAYRCYVQNLSAGYLPEAELKRLQEDFSRLHTVEDRAEFSTHALTELTHNVGIAAAIPAASQTLDHVELVMLSDRRVLMIVMTRDGAVRTRVVPVEEAIPEPEMVSLRNYVNRNFSGWTLPEARGELARRLQEESAAYDDLLRRLSVFYANGLLEVDLAPEVYMDGAFNLVGLDLHLTRERMRELFQALEEKKRLLELLDRFLEQPSGTVAVQVGLGEAHPSMKELSLIGVSVAGPGGHTAKIAVLGPMRMDYEGVMAAVFSVAHAVRGAEPFESLLAPGEA